MPEKSACILSGSSAAAVIARPGRLSTEQGHTRAMATLASVPLPKLIETVRRGYSIHAFLNDLVAGVTVGLVALPLAMAFAIASGAAAAERHLLRRRRRLHRSPRSAARASRSAARPARSSSWSPASSRAYGLDGLFMCTLMAGVILILLGVTGLGTAVQVHSAAGRDRVHQRHRVLIASTQIRDFFGLQTGDVAGDFLGRVRKR